MKRSERTALIFLCGMAAVPLASCAFSGASGRADGGSPAIPSRVIVHGICSIGGGALPSEFVLPERRASLSAAASPRTALPDLDDMLSNLAYDVSFTSASTGETIAAVIHEDLTFAAVLPVGGWTYSGKASYKGTVVLESAANFIEITGDFPDASLAAVVLAPYAGGSGGYSFAIDCDPKIKNAQWMWKKAGDADFGEGSKKTVELSGGAGTCAGRLDSGAYCFVFCFYADSGELVYTCTESVNIFNGLETDKWSGGAAYIADGAISITSELLERFCTTTFFVDGENGDDGNSGGYFSPFKTVGKAASRCGTDAEHAVFVRGVTEESEPVVAAAGARISVKPMADGETAEIAPAPDFSDTIDSSASEGRLAYVFGTLSVSGVSLRGRAACVRAGGRFSFSDGTISDSVGDTGGAVFVDGGGTAFISRAKIERCIAKAGGAVCVLGSAELELDDVEIADCAADTQGGAVSVSGAVRISNSKIERCKVTDGNARGGALHVDKNGAAELKNVNIIGCDDTSAAYGGAVYASGKVDIFGGTIEKCAAAVSGGAIFVHTDGNVSVSTVPVAGTLAGTAISDCAAAQSGGGVRNGGTLLLDHVSIEGCRTEARAENGADSYGGSALFNDGRATLKNVKITRCVSGDCGTLYNCGTELSFDTGSIAGCEAACRGGAVYERTDTNGTALADVKIEKCSARLDGGAVYVYSGATEISGGEISGCSVGSAGKGGAVYVGSSGGDGAVVVSGGVRFESGNDIYLESGTAVAVSGALTGVAPIATITPASYIEGLPILAAGGGYTLTEEDCARFVLSDNSWKAALQGAAGVLSR